MIEQRRTKRFEMELPVEIIRTGSDLVSEAGTTRNISSGGILFVGVRAIEIDSPVEYVVTLTSGISGAVNLRCMGKVLRLETFPSEDLLQLALRSSDFMDALNRETLTVTGLTPRRTYALKIDGQAIVSHSAGQWSAGVNLGPEITPMSNQAIEVLQLIYRHNNLHWARWHMIQTSFETEQPPSMDRAMSAVDTLETEVSAMARAKAQPKPHRYQLVEVE